MNIGKRWAVILPMLVGSLAAFCQHDSLNHAGRAGLQAGGQLRPATSANAASPATESLLQPRAYLRLLANSFQKEVTQPFHMSGKDWKAVGIFAAGTSALFLVDQPIQRGTLQLRNQSSALKEVSHAVTNFGGVYEVCTLGALGGYGLIFKKSRTVTTTLLASQAYLTGAVLVTALKFLTGETRPSYYRPDQVASPRFLGPFTKAERDASGKKTYSSFPSGHTTVAFAVATVFASQYRDKPVIPVLVYSLASLIGVSRITENVHWTTDVFAGAALGYVTGKTVVRAFRRMARPDRLHGGRNTLSFQLQYNVNHLEPGLVYTFRR